MPMIPQTDSSERAIYFRVPRVRIDQWIAQGLDVNDPIQVAWRILKDRSEIDRSIDSVFADLDANTDPLSHEY
jgi:hypothetical protein